MVVGLILTWGNGLKLYFYYVRDRQCFAFKLIAILHSTSPKRFKKLERSVLTLTYPTKIYKNKTILHIIL